jgi:hypothetical protein
MFFSFQILTTKIVVTGTLYVSRGMGNKLHRILLIICAAYSLNYNLMSLHRLRILGMLVLYM